MQTETNNIAEVQRETIKQLQKENDDLQTKQSVTESKLLDLESLLSWEKLQHSNLVQSLNSQLDDRDAKIIRLSKKVFILMKVQTHPVCI